MNPSTFRQKVQEEISLIPEERIEALYEMIHQFRVRSRPPQGRGARIMRLAGSWADMTEDDFESFTREITDRRRRAGSGRRRHEARLD